MKNRLEGRILNNKKLLCSVGEKYVLYAKGKLYLSDIDGTDERLLVALQGKMLKKILCKFRLMERFARLEPRLATELNEHEFLLSYQGMIARINIDGTMTIEHKYRPTMNNPISFCVYGERIFYGEYFGNFNHEEVSIYERLPQGGWEKRYTFAAGMVQHIHQICFDEFRNCFWIMTGDKDDESAIWRASMDFSNVEPIFKGKQKYRSCFIMPSEKGIAYSTDTPLESNGIFVSEELEDGGWTEPVKQFEMPGPCIYGKKLRDGNYVMATSVEPDASLPPFQYYLSGKLGKGVRDRYSAIVYGRPDGSFMEIAKYKKDPYKMWLFQFGNIIFPNIREDDRVICTGQSLKGIDGKTLEIRIKENSEA